MSTAFWFMVAVTGTALFTFLTFVVWFDGRRKEREAHYRNEMARQIAEAGNAGPILEFVRANERAAAERVQMWLSVGGLVTIAVGAALMIFLYALVPMAFGVWLSHYAFHFLTGALTLIPVTQSFLNDVGLYVGQPLWHLGPIVPTGWLFPLQTIFLYLGIFGSLVVGFQIAVNHYKIRSVAVRAFIPWGVLSLILLLAAFWIMLQPMEMRGTLFMGL